MHPMALIFPAAAALAATLAGMASTPVKAAGALGEPTRHAIAAQAAPGPQGGAEAGGDASTEAAEDQLVRKSRPLFGGVAEVVVYAPSADDARAAFGPVEAAFDEMRRIEVLVDEEDARSPVARINSTAGGEPVVVEPELYAILASLQGAAKLSKGAFDMTSAAFTDAWRFGGDDPLESAPTKDPLGTADARARQPVPKKTDLERARSMVGFGDLLLDATRHAVRLKTAGERIAVRAVARGYALERAAKVLADKGYADAVLSVGGDVVVRGQHGGRPWMVGVQDPRAEGSFAAFAADSGLSVMSTGDYEDFFFDGGVRYHSILDPRTGQPASKCRSVTVVGKDALLAEALSRAVFVLGPKDGLALVERISGLGAIIVGADNRVVVSRSLKPLVQMRPPTDGP